MQKYFEKIKERLEETEKRLLEHSKEIGCTIGITNAMTRAIKIVNQVAEECSSSEIPNKSEKVTGSDDGWISVSERLPEEKGEYYVTYHPCYWDNVYDEVCVGLDTFRGKTSWAQKKYQRVIAWKPKDAPYQPKGE